MLARWYQREAIDFGVAALSAHKRALVQLPTGTGKTLVLLRIAEKWLRDGKPIYLIAPTEQVVSQLYQTARRLGLFACLDTKDSHAPSKARFVITTYSCAWRRYRSRIHANTLCLLDECHHINFRAPVNLGILSSFQAAIGVSATPWSKGCRAYFEKNSYRYRLSRAITDGSISQYEIAPWSDPRSGQFQIIYTDNGDYRKQLCSTIPEADYAIYKRPIAQRVIERFRRGLVGTIIVNRMLTEGFDLPQIKGIWIARNTRSRIAIMQMAGRALRPFENRKAILYPFSADLQLLLNQALQRAG